MKKQQNKYLDGLTVNTFSANVDLGISINLIELN